MMKQIGAAVSSLNQEDILSFEKESKYLLAVEDHKIELTLEDVEILSEDIPGWLVATEGNITVALDIHIDEDLKNEGIARELVNRIQNLRKDSGFEVTDKIEIEIEKHEAINSAIVLHGEYIGSQTLADKVTLVERMENRGASRIDLEDDVFVKILVSRL